MLYFSLPKGDKMPMLGLGTYELRGSDGAAAVASAIEIGYRHIDTAATYENEDAVGEGILKSGVDRSQLFVTTKVDRVNLKTDDFIKSCENSLSLLKMDYVDLLLIHWPNKETPIEETLAAFEKLVSAGKAKNIGVSNFIRPNLQEILDKSSLPIAVNQVEYHAHLQQKKLNELCQKNNVLLTAYSPIGQGCLLKDPVLEEIASKAGRTTAQVALRWLLQSGIAAIPRSTSTKRMKENFGAASFELDAADMANIDAIKTRKRVIEWWPGEFDKDPDVYG